MWFDSWSILFYDFFPVFSCFQVSQMTFSADFTSPSANENKFWHYFFFIFVWYISQIFFWYFGGEVMLKKTPEPESTNTWSFFTKICFDLLKTDFCLGIKIYKKAKKNIKKKSRLGVWSDFVLDLMISWGKFVIYLFEFWLPILIPKRIFLI